MNKKLLLTAFAGLGAALPATSQLQAKTQCWGAWKAKETGCGVGPSDIKVATKEFGKKYEGSTLHDCAGMGLDGKLGWRYTASDSECFKFKGFLIKGAGKKKRVVTSKDKRSK